MFSNISSANEEPYCRITNWDLLRRSSPRPDFSGYQEDDVHYPMIQKKQMTKKCGEKEIKQKWQKMEKKNMERFITHSAPDTLFHSREWRPGRWTSKSYQIFCCLEKSDEKKLGNFGLKQDTFIFSSKILIIRIDPMFLRVLATIHSTFCLKRPKKKHVPKSDCKSFSQSNSPKWVCSLKRSPWTDLNRPKKSNHSV